MVSPKRSLSPSQEDDAGAKRQKLDSQQLTPTPTPTPSAGSQVTPETQDEQSQTVVGDVEEPLVAVKVEGPTQHSQARSSIQRAIALVLEHDGFSAAHPQALERFTAMVETYLESLIEETKRFAVSARREHPIPSDFESTLRRFNLPISSLKPHLKNPIPQERLAPSYADVITIDEDAFATLPLLGPELSGQADKDEKQYIPSSFPDFPSRHTYRFTPQNDTRSRDSKRIREEAARTAQQGEDALRRLVRASKMRKQKEVKSLVERDSQGKERFRLWETTMKRFIGADGRAEHADPVEIADHSMIVNGELSFLRKEVSRLGKRNANLPHKGA